MRNVDTGGGVGQAPRMAKPALGRGLGALLSGSPPAGRAAAPAPVPTPPAAHLGAAAAFAPAAAPDTRERVERVALDRIRPGALQPRKDFDEAALRELSDSIREQGVVQPLIVRPLGDGYELIAGERRWRAARLAGLTEVPVLVRTADDRSVLELGLIENLQRENLNPIEEAQGYAQLIEQFQLKQEEAAAKVGKSRTVVANALRLLRLPAAVQEAVRHNRLSVGHAKAILGLPEAARQEAAAGEVFRHGLNVRQTEALVNEWLAPVPPAAPTTPEAAAGPRDPNLEEIVNQLRERFGTKVRLRYAAGKGSLDIAFFNDDDLERVLQILGVQID